MLKFLFNLIYLQVAIHELLHAMGFSKRLLKKFKTCKPSKYNLFYLKHIKYKFCPESIKSPCSIVANMLDFNIVVSLNSSHTIMFPFQTNTFRKMMNPLILPPIG